MFDVKIKQKLSSWRFIINSIIFKICDNSIKN